MASLKNDPKVQALISKADAAGRKRAVSAVLSILKIEFGHAVDSAKVDGSYTPKQLKAMGAGINAAIKAAARGPAAPTPPAA